jgi:hypothetical protein
MGGAVVGGKTAPSEVWSASPANSPLPDDSFDDSFDDS